MLEVISLGAGVQSTTMALMAAHGEIEPMPDLAIFADTGAEPSAVYEHLTWLRSPNVLPFRVIEVENGNILADIDAAIVGTKRRGSAPFFMAKDDREAIPMRRQCTDIYKIRPINKVVKSLIGEGEKASVWIGISLDEAHRMKPDREAYVERRYPLIERRLSRLDCLNWMERKGYPRPPRSACTFCPYHSDAEWRRLRDTDSDGWNQATAIDEKIRKGFRQPTTGNINTPNLYLHRSLTPLAEADLRTDSERGQLDMWAGECEGMCGV